jgi:nucleoside-diphosphate-sugar epimerase
VDDRQLLGMKVLVCGAAGWLGRAITDVLIESGFEVRAFDRDISQWTKWEGIPSAGMNGRLSEQDSPNIKGYVNGRHVGNASIQRAIIGHGGKLEMCYGDITDYDTVAKLVDGVEAIVHATAYFPKSNVDEMAWRVNCGGLWNVLDCARNSKLVKRVVHIGSCHTKWPGSTRDPGKNRCTDSRSVLLYANYQKKLANECFSAIGCQHRARLGLLRRLSASAR